jgi:hypothetical protein
MRILAVVGIVGAALAAAATAAVPATLTIAASAPVVVYGKTATLTGALSTKRANQVITLQVTECGVPPQKKVANVKTVAEGAYTTTVTPAVNSLYQASQKRLASNTVAVAVAPTVQLARVARGRFTATVTAGLDLKGKTVLFQRYAKLRKRWIYVKKVVLTTSVPGPAKPTMVSSSRFKAKVARRARVRLVFAKAQAAPCYVGATSNVVRA